jgi:membrane protein implicated in regulation of membrane protease activity
MYVIIVISMVVFALFWSGFFLFGLFATSPLLGLLAFIIMVAWLIMLVVMYRQKKQNKSEQHYEKNVHY